MVAWKGRKIVTDRCQFGYIRLQEKGERPLPFPLFLFRLYHGKADAALGLIYVEDPYRYHIPYA